MLLNFCKRGVVATTLILIIFLGAFFSLSAFSAEAAGVPSILSYQGRLTDSSGNLLGGNGTLYSFKFSLWDNATVGSGTRLWPTSAPSSYSTTVRRGVFNANIGDTANGYPDTLDYAFTSANVYLQVEVSSDGITFETLSPRQTVSASAFAKVAGAVSGTNQSSIGTTTPRTDSVLTVQSTTTSSVPLTVLGAVGQTGNLLNVRDASFNHLFSVNNLGGIFASSTLQVTGATQLYAGLTGTTATFSGALSADSITGSTLTVSGLSLFGRASTTLASSLGGFFAGNTSTTTIFGDNATSTFAGAVDISRGIDVGNYIYGAGLATCIGSGDKIVWSNGVFSCGVDAGGGGGSGISAMLAQYSSAQVGATQTLATSSDTNIQLTITSAGDVHTFTPVWSGTLAASRGGTGVSNPTAAGILLGSYAGGGWQQVATSSLGLLTTHVGEGSNLYFTDERVDDRAAALIQDGAGISWTYSDVGNTLTPAVSLSSFTTDNLVEGATNKYYSAYLFSNTLAGTTTDALAQGTINKYYSTYLFSGSLAGTTTDALAEGTVNKYWSSSLFNTSFDNRLSATTSLPSITTLSNLSLAATQLTNFGVPFYQFLSATTTDALAQGVTNLYYNNDLVNAYIHASSTIAKTYRANTWTGLQQFAAGASTTQLSAYEGIYVGTTATTTILGTATSTFGAGIQTTALNVTGATSTFANGIRLASGCLSINGTCIGTTTGTVTSVQASGGTTGLSFSGGPITSSGTLTLAGTLNVANGGTGWASVLSGALLYGNGTGALATTTAGTNGQVLALANGVPTWVASTTFSSGLTYVNGNVTLDATGNWTGTFDGQEGSYYLNAANLTNFGTPFYTFFNATTTDALAQGAVNKYYSTYLFSGSLAGTTTDALAQGGTNLYYNNSLVNAYIHASTTIPKTYTANTFGGLQQFNQSSTTLASIYNGLYVGSSATTTIFGSATSTFGAGIQTAAVNVTGSATSTFANGIQLAGGCFRGVNGSCVGTTNGTVTSVDVSGGTTGLSFAGGPITSSGSLTMSGILTTANGGTGWASILPGTILYGNGSGRLATTSAGTNGNVLALLNGIPTWVASTTYSGGLTFANGNVTLDATGNWTGTFDGQEGSYYLNAANLTNFGTPFYTFFNATTTDALAQGSVNKYYSDYLFGGTLAGTTTDALDEGTVNKYYSDTLVNTFINSSSTIAKTYTSQSWSALQQFAQSSTTLASIYNGLYVGSNGTTTIYGSATSTFGAGIQTTALNVTGATSTFANGINLASGCLAINGTCVGAGAGSVSSVDASGGTTGLTFTGGPITNSGTLTLAGTLVVANGGTGWNNIQAGTVLYGNGTSRLATTSAGTNGQILALSNGVPTWVASTTFSTGLSYVSGNVTLDSSYANDLINTFVGASSTIAKTYTNNVFSGLQQFNQSSTTLASIYSGLYVGASATTTILGSATSTFGAGIQTTYINQTGSTGTSTFAGGVNFARGINVSSYLYGAGLSSCTGSGDKLLWSGGQFVCGADAGAGGGITALGAQYSSFQIGSSQSFATTSDTNIRLTITSAGDVHTFTPSWSGTLAATRGGTGIANPGAAGILVGSYAGGDWQQIATSSLGLSSTDIIEGTKLFYTDARLNSYINGSTTIAKTYTTNTWSALNTFNGGLTIGSLNGPLQANNGVVSATSSIGVLYGGTGLSSPPAYGQMLVGNASGGYTLTATSSLGLASLSQASQWTTSGSNIYYNSGNVGIGTTSPGQALSVGGDILGNTIIGSSFIGTTTATSTLAGGLQTTALNVTGSATSTFNRGITLAGGCFAINGVCIGTYGDSNVNSYIHSSSTIPKTYTANTFTALNTFNAGLTASALTVGSLNGPLQANNGVVSATSSIGVMYGGTGWSNIQTGAVIYGNGTGALATTTAGTNGQILAYLNGIPTWTATTTFGTGLSYVSGNVTLDATGNWTGTFDGQEGSYYLNAANLTNFGTPFYTFFNATTTDALAQGVTNLYYNNALVNAYIHSSSTIAKTYTANTFTALNTFNGGLTLGTLNGPLQANNGVVSATTSVGVLYGGTGLSSAPSYGQLLLGNASGGYTLTATSSLGLASASQASKWTTLGANIYYTTGNVGIGTTTPGQALSVAGDILGNNIIGSYFTGTTTATSTLAGGLQTLALNITGTATSTFNRGINLAGGCFAVNGTCITNSTYGNSDVNAYIHASTTIPKTYTANTFTGLQQFGQSSTTLASIYNGLYIGSSATTTIQGSTSGTSTFQGFINVAGTNSTSTFSGGLAATYLNITGTGATSTFARGINLAGGCFAINGTCTGTYGDSNVNSYIHASTTIPKLYTTNTFTGLNSFARASSTLLSVFNTLYIGTSATTTIQGSTSGTSTFQGFINVAGTNSTSTFSGGIQTTALNLTGSATSTFNRGITLAGGCFAINGVCIGTTTGTVTSVQASGGTTGLSFSGGPITSSGTLTLAGTLNVANGGTGWASVLSGALLYGNGTGALATTTAGTNGQVLALANGVPTWVASTTFSSGLTYLGGNVTLDSTFANNLTNSYIHSSSTIAKTYTANTFTALNTFSGGLTIGSLNGPLQANNGVVSATTSVGVLYGGTGLSSAPSYGQLLLGNASGGYTLTATSSLGLASASQASQWTTAGSDIYYNTGKVGIGTSSPYAALSVAGATGVVANVFNATSTTATSTFAGNVAIGRDKNGLTNSQASTTLTIRTQGPNAFWSDTGLYIDAAAYISEIATTTGIKIKGGGVEGSANAVGIENIMTMHYNQNNMIGLYNNFYGTDYSQNNTWGVLNDMIYKTAGDYYGLQNRIGYDYAFGAVTGNSYGVYTDIPNAHEGDPTTATNVYGTYTVGRTFSSGIGNFYGNYVVSNAASTGGTQYGFYADLTAGSSTKYPAILLGGNVGIGTTTPYAALSVAGATGVVANVFNATSTTATSTFAWGVSANAFNMSGTGTSTLSGLTLSRGLNAGSYLYGAGLSSACSGAGDKLIWNNGVFSCGADAGAGGGITALGAQYSSFQTGSSQTFATSSDANIQLTITSVGDVHTFAPSWTGTLSVARGGTGLSSTPSYGEILVGNGTGYTLTATSSLGLASLAQASKWTANGSDIYYNTGNVGIGTTSPYAKLSVAGTVVADRFIATSTTASSTFAWGVQAAALNITGSATSTFANGINLASGCFAVNGVCAGTGNGSVNSGSQYQVAMYSANGTAVSGTSTITIMDERVGIASTTPFGILSVGSTNANNTRPLLSIASSTGSTNLRYGIDGKLAINNGSLALTYNLTNTQVWDSPFTGFTSAINAPATGADPTVTDVTAGTFYVDIQGMQFDTVRGVHVGGPYGSDALGTNYIGVDIDNLQADSGSIIGTAKGLNVQGVTTSNNSLIETNYGIYVGSPYANDANGIRNNYGLFLADMSADNTNLAATSTYAIYSEGGKSYFGGNVGIGTTSPYAALSVAGATGVVANVFNATSTTATSTFAWGLQANALNVTGTATSTFNRGINLAGGCFAVNGTCIGGSSYGDSNVNSYIHSSSTIAKTYTANTFSALNTFNGGLTIGSLNGPLQANNGVVSATTSVGVLYGGTGLSSAPAYGQLLVGNASGGYTLTATSSLGITSQWTTAGSDIYYNTGKVGIGTSSPYAMLSVAGEVVARNFVATSTTMGGFKGSNGSSAFPTFSFINDSDTGIYNYSGFGQIGFAVDGSAILSLDGGGLLAEIGGSAAVPFYGYNSDLGADTGMYSGSEDTLGFSTGGVERLVIGSTGNIGVGTSSPYAALSVAGATGVVANVFNATSTTATSTFAWGLQANALNVTGTATSTFNRGINLSSGCFAINGVCAGTGNGTVNSGTTGQIAYYSGNGTAVVGTSTLTFGTDRTALFTGPVIMNGTGGIGDGYVSVYETSGAQDAFYAESGTYAGILAGSVTTAGGAFFGPGGNVLAGGAVRALDVTGTSVFQGDSDNTTLTIFASAGQSEDVLAVLADEAIASFLNVSPTYLSVDGGSMFYDFSGNKLTVTGSLGIGTTSPGQKLSVAGDILGNNIIGSYFTGTTTATSTLAGGLQTLSLNVTSTLATSTFANGLRVNAGGIQLSSLLNCNTASVLETDANGVITCGSDAGASGTVTSVTNADGTLTIVPTAGDVVASLNLSNSNVWTGLQRFTNASSTRLSVFDTLYIGGSATTTIQGSTSGTSTFQGFINVAGTNSTSTFSGGLAAAALNVTGSATSTFNRGINLAGGCFSINGTCIGGASSQWTTAGSDIHYGTGNVGIGTSTPYAKLSVVGQVVASNFHATNTNATSTFEGGFYASGLAVFDNIQLGAMNFETNAGAVTWVDLPIDASAPNNTVESYSASLNGTPILTVYGQADGAGNIKNTAVGIGTTSPYAALSVAGATGIVANLYTATSTTATSTLQGTVLAALGGSVGIGTTTPGNSALLGIAGNFYVGGQATSTILRGLNVGLLNVSSTTASSTFANGINLTSGCFAVNGTCIGGGGSYGDTNVNSYIHASTTIPKTYTANTFTGLQQFNQSSTTLASVYNGLYVGSNGTTTILGSATSTFGAGVQATYLNITGASASSTFANGINLSAGCFSVNGVCVGSQWTTAGSDIHYGTGNVGIGTSTPYAKLSVVGQVVATNFHATSSSATSTFAGGLNVGNGGLVYDFTTGITSIASLETGAFNFDTDAGMISWTDLPVTSAASSGTVESYTAQIDGNPLLTVFAQADGSGGIMNSRIGVGSTTPYSRFSVWGAGTGTGQLFELTNSASTTLARILDNGTAYLKGNLGIGTTSPYAALSVVGDIVAARFVGTTTATSTLAGGLDALALNVTGTATSTFNRGINLAGGCFAINGTCIGGSGGSGTVSSGTQYQVAFYNADGTTVSGTSTLTIRDEKIGIGTTSPYAKLSVAGQVVADYFTSTSSTASRFPYASTTALSVSGAAYLSGTTTIATASTTLYTDSNRWVGLPELYLTRTYSRFNLGTTSPNNYYNYYLAHLDDDLSSRTQGDSGIAFWPNRGTLLIINNNNHEIYEYTLNGEVLLRTITLTNFTDEEDIVWMYDDTFAILDESESNITITQINSTQTSLNQNAAGNTLISFSGTVGTGTNVGAEGLGYDQDRDLFWIVKEKTSASIHTVSRGGTVTTPFTLATLLTNAGMTDASAIYFDRNTQHIFIAADEGGSDKIIEADTSGNLITTMLAPSAFGQLEGFTFSPDGENMWLSGEADDFARYQYQRPNSAFAIIGTSDYPNIGIGTTSPYAALSVVGASGVVASKFNATSTTATSTFAWGLQANALSILSTSATSTFANGIALSAGCFSLNGSCIGAGSGSGTVSTGVAGYFAYYSGNGTIVDDQTILNISGSNIGIGTSTPYAALSVAGATGVVANVYNATSTTATSTFAGDLRVTGNIGIGSTTQLSKLTIDKNGGIASTSQQTVGINQYYKMDLAGAGTQFGNQMYVVNAPTINANVMVGSMFRVEDSTSLANTVRGIEVQAHRGTNTQGENTGVSAFGRTFGLRGITEGDAGGLFLPAGVFAQTRGTTQGNALRAYSGTITSADLAYLYQDTSTFTGNALLMDMGTGGSFTGNFINLKKAGVSKFVVDDNGTTTIGDGSVQAGLQIGFGGICVDNDGACTASTTGRITAVQMQTANSDLAEMYFSDDELSPGELVYTKGSYTIGRADAKNKGAIIGVVSSKPGLLLGFDDAPTAKAGYPVALAGRVPVKVSTENGTIKAGDKIVLSSIDGIGMKQTGEGMIVGVALEDFDGNTAVGEAVIDQLNDNNEDPTAAQRIVIEEDSCYASGGGEIGSEVCEKTDASERTKVIKDPKTKAATTSIAAAEHLAEQKAEAQKMNVKIGTIQMFVSLGWSRLDANLAGMSTSTIATNWYVDQNTGAMSTDFFMNADFKGIAFNKIRSIASFNNKWSIDENGKVTAEVVEAKAVAATESLEVGTAARPTGITIFDTITNEPYCMQLANGAMKSVKGRCEDIKAPAPTPSMTPSPIQGDEVDETPDTNNSTTTPEATPEPTTTPEPSTPAEGGSGSETPAPTPSTPPVTEPETPTTPVTETPAAEAPATETPAAPASESAPATSAPETESAPEPESASAPAPAAEPKSEPAPAPKTESAPASESSSSESSSSDSASSGSSEPAS